MTDMDILIIIGLIGITMITSQGGVFRSLKSKIKDPLWIEFSVCAQCQGFWIGLIGYIVFYFSNPMDIFFWLKGILYGGMISVCSLTVSRLIS
jgi:hypothetical protein